MIAIPAVDLRGGACVQLVGGSYADERVRLPDPVAIAQRWSALGFSRLHAVDLDAATGAGDNADVIDEILAVASAATQVGGGIRSTERIRHLVSAGATAVIVGTRAIDDLEWLGCMARMIPGRIVVAADVRGREVQTHGWTRGVSRDVADFVGQLSALPLGGFLVTAVHLEGRMRGTDLPLMESVVRASAHPVIASGGVTTIGDLEELGRRGVSAAVIGMALYSGALDARAVAQEFG